MTETMTEAALGLARAGYAVLPIWALAGGVCRCPAGGACKSPGKHPVTVHGVKEASRDEATIRAWWKAWPWAWLAVATGAPSGGRWVLDVDVKAPATAPGAALGVPGLDALGQLQTEHGLLPETLTTRTGSGGLHVWFSGPGGEANRARVRLDGRPAGIDVRGTGGYVLVPPSGHASGGGYEWERWAEPVEAPGWLLDWLRQERPVGARVARPTVGAMLGGSDDARIRAWGRTVLARAVDRILEVDGVAGARHRAIYAQARTVGGALWAMDASQARAALVDAGVYVYGGQATDGEVGRTVDAGLALGVTEPIEAPPDRPHPVDVSRLGAVAGMVDRGGAEMVRPDLSTLPELPPTRWADDDLPPPIEGPPGGDREAPGGDRQSWGRWDGYGEEVPPPSAPGWERRTVIHTGTDMLDLLRVGWAVLASYPGSTLFRQDGRLVTLQSDDDGALRVVEVDQGTLLYHLCQAAKWCVAKAPKAGVATVQHGGASVHVVADKPPRELAAMMLKSVGEHLPVLIGVAQAPIFVRGPGDRPRLVTERGYSVLGRCWVGGERHEHEAMTPARAIGVLEDWLGEFPFESPADVAAAVGFLLSVIARRSWQGPALGLLVDAPMARTGKSLLVDCLLYVATGQWVPVATPGGDPEAARKALLALARSGAPVWLDNVKGSINSSTMEALLTASKGFADRGLFTDAARVFSTGGLSLVVTANGAELSKDTRERMAVCRLDARCADPGARLIRRPKLRGWTEEHRHTLRSACIELIQAGLADDRPWGSLDGEARRGGFEGCQDVVGRALRAAGLGQYWLHLSTEASERLTPYEASWQALVEWWVRARRGGRMPLADVLAQAAEMGLQILAPGEHTGSLSRRGGQTWEVDGARWRGSVRAGSMVLQALDGQTEGGAEVVDMATAQRRA